MRRFNKKRVGKQGLLWKQLLGQPWRARGGAAGGGLSCLGGWRAVPKGFSLTLERGNEENIAR